MVTMKKRFLVLGLFILLITTFGCAKAHYPGTMNIIEPETVLQHVAQEDHVVLDARSPEAYEKGHLKGAISFPPSKVSQDLPVPGMLAGKEQVQKALQEAGIKESTTLYLYDDQQGVMASRIWWSLKVYGHEKVLIVNRGSSGLVAAGGEVTLEVPSITRSSYTIQDQNSALIATKEDVEKAIQENSAKLLDVRSQAEYDAGFIPGAIHYPHTNNVFSDGNFVSTKGIDINYRELGLEKDTPIILYCKTSFRAAQTMALMEEAGFTNLRLYDGAWLEWEGGGATDAPTPAAPPAKSDGS